MLSASAQVFVAKVADGLIGTLVLVLFLFKLAERKSFDRALLKHPVSLALYFYLGWMLITALTSTMPLVSLKFWLAKIWFLVAFYWMGILFFRNKKIELT